MNRELRILQIFNEYVYKGGEETAVNTMAKLLSEAHPFADCRFTSEELVQQDAAPEWQQAVRMVYNRRAITQIRELQSSFNGTVWLLHNLMPVGSAGIYREIRKQNIPVIHFIHNFRPFSVNGYLWANGGIEEAGLRKNFWPEILDGAWQDSVLKTAWYGMIMKTLHGLQMYRHVTLWVAVSDFIRHTFIRAGIPEDKIVTLRHAWEPTESSSAIQDQGYYVYLGGLIEMKGVPTLLQTWEILREKLGDKCPPLHIGGEGALKENVKQAEKQNPFVHYEGHVTGDKKAQLLRGMRAMIAPSVWWEPLGLVTYEAYDHCKPILAARSGGLCETVEHERTGLLHQPGKAQELAEHILKMESQPQWASELGRNGKNWLLDHTRPSDWMNQFHTLCDRVLNNSTVS